MGVVAHRGVVAMGFGSEERERERERELNYNIWVYHSATVQFYL